ncbi:MAG: zinc-ribbon domain-containing protein [Lachnospiraceae bacterium]|nr:zinc-ribbon domain-containing protein [Lachnospiraceae bacterium]
MFCMHCGAEADEHAVFCSKCGQRLHTDLEHHEISAEPGVAQNGIAVASLVLGCVGILAWLIPLFGFPITILGLVFGIIGVKKGGKGIAITGIVLSTITLLFTTVNSAIGFYMGYTGQLWFQQENDEEVKNSDFQKAMNNSKEYRVVSDTTLTQDEMDAVVYNLQRRAEEYTSEAVVLMRERKACWYVEICMPGVEESAYQSVVRDVDLKFIGGYGTENEEIIVTNENVQATSVSVNESSYGTKNFTVNILFDEEGTRAFAIGTEKYIGQPISIVLDGKEISAPVVQCVIPDGKATVSFSSYEEADAMASFLRMGTLGIYLEEVE